MAFLMKERESHLAHIAYISVHVLKLQKVNLNLRKESD